MTRTDIINEIVGETNVDKKDALIVLETFYDVVKKSLSQGKNVTIRGFGSFKLKKRAAKTGRDIKKNRPIFVPEHYIPFFQPSRQFEDLIKTSTQDEGIRKQIDAQQASAQTSEDEDEVDFNDKGD